MLSAARHLMRGGASLNLRAACGAQPHTAAAQAAPADALGPGPEAAELLTLVAATAAELGLTWLR